MNVDKTEGFVGGSFGDKPLAIPKANFASSIAPPQDLCVFVRCCLGRYLLFLKCSLEFRSTLLEVGANHPSPASFLPLLYL